MNSWDDVKKFKIKLIRQDEDKLDELTKLQKNKTIILVE